MMHVLVTNFVYVWRCETLISVQGEGREEVIPDLADELPCTGQELVASLRTLFDQVLGLIRRKEVLSPASVPECVARHPCSLAWLLLVCVSVFRQFLKLVAVQ